MSLTAAPSGYTSVPLMMQPSVLPQQAQQQLTHSLTSCQQKSMRNLSALQVVMGALCILVHSVLLGIQRYNYDSYRFDVVGTGIWCGVFFLISGSLGLLAAKHNTTSLIVATMAMSIISSIAVWSIVAFSAAGLGVSSTNKDRCHTNPSGYYYSTDCKPPNVYDGFLAADSLLLVFTVAEFVLAVWSSSLCCRAVCCCSYSVQPVYYMTYPAGGQQVIFMPQQGPNVQPMMVVQQQGQFMAQDAVFMPSGGSLQGQTTYMPTTVGIMPPPYSQLMSMMPSTTQAVSGYGEVEKQPLPPVY